MYYFYILPIIHDLSRELGESIETLKRVSWRNFFVISDGNSCEKGSGKFHLVIFYSSQTSYRGFDDEIDFDLTFIVEFDA